MNGTYKRSRNYRALALSVLGCAYLAVAPVSALAQDAGGRGVSVTVNPTTGYAVINSSTVGTPRGATVGPSGGPPSVTVRPAGGLSQSLPAGIEITGMRENAQTLRGSLGAKVNAGAGVVRNAAVRCLTSLRCNAGLALGGAGLQLLLDQIDGLIDESGRLNIRGEKTYASYPPGTPDIAENSSTTHWSSTGECSIYQNNNRTLVYESRSAVGGLDCHTCSNILLQGRHLVGFRPPRQCQYSYSVPPISETIVYGPTTIPTPSEVSDLVDTHYSPQPSDWNWLTGGMNFSDPDVTIEITDIPVLDGSNEPNFIEWSDGTSRGTYNVYTPTVTNNASHKPEISVKDEQFEITFDDQGNPTGSSTSTTVTPPSTSTGGGGAPAAEVPTDCDFMPTVCRFIDWFTEPDPSPDPDQEIRDLVQVYEDGGRQVDLGPSVGACPPPRTIALSFVPEVEVSFQPFCDLAAAVRYWLLAIASFGAAYLTVRSI